MSANGMITMRCQSTTSSTRRFRCALPLSVSLISCLLATCVPYSKTLLLTEANSRIDEALLGVWWTEEGERFEIERGEPETTALVVKDERDEDLILRTTSLRDVSIIATTYTDQRDPDHRACEIVKYCVSRDGSTFEVFSLDERKTANAIESGKLTGTVVRNERRGLFTPEFKSIVIDDTSENILKFLDKHGNDVFKKTPLLTFTREKPEPSNERKASLLRLLFTLPSSPSS